MLTNCTCTLIQFIDNTFPMLTKHKYIYCEYTYNSLPPKIENELFPCKLNVCFLFLVFHGYSDGDVHEYIIRRNFMKIINQFPLCFQFLIV